MGFSIVDSDGDQRGRYGTLDGVVDALRRIRAYQPALLAELFVLSDDDGDEAPTGVELLDALDAGSWTIEHTTLDFEEEVVTSEDAYSLVPLAA